jgi:hypothetical protein
MIKKIIKETLVLVVGLCLHTEVWSQGNLLVTPVRVVFENSKLKEDLNVTNLGQDSASFLMSFVHYRMMPDGSFQVLEKVDSLTSADKYLRLFPRRVKLGPNESQTLRLQCRKTAGMKEGEYRTHLYFRAEKEAAPLGMENKKIDSTQMSVRITAIFGISIPVIIRNGNLKAENSLTDVALKSLTDSTSVVSFKINRSGNRSSYGNVKVEFIPEKGLKKELASAKGIGVYPEITSRDLSMVLHWPAELKSRTGKLVVRYTLPTEEGGAQLAQTEYLIH